MDTSGIDNILSQLRAVSGKASGSITPGEEAGVTGSVDFGQVLKTAVDQVSSTQQESDRLAKEFELGTSDANLHEVMASLQKANISFQTMVQVRNKLVAAYRDIMNMQV